MRCKDFFSVNASFAADYALNYVITMQLKLVSWAVVSLIAAKIMPHLLPIPGFSLSNKTLCYDIVYAKQDA
jgi:hypothetical protein